MITHLERFWPLVVIAGLAVLFLIGCASVPRPMPEGAIMTQRDSNGVFQYRTVDEVKP